MERETAPQPATALVSQTGALSSKQREVFQAIQERPEGMQVSELSSELGMHVNTVRGHLDELMAHGVVARQILPSPGRGRPSHVYTTRAPRTDLAATALIALVEVLISTQAENDTEVAEQLGRQWAQRAQQVFDTGQGKDLTTVTSTTLEVLRDLGFDPEVRRESSGPKVSEIALRACPFITEAGQRPAPIVCALHAGFVAGGIDTHRVELLPFYRPGACSVLISEFANKRTP